MISMISEAASTIVRWAIYLSLMGGVATCSQAELKVKAGRSVRTGLISLEAINQSLHSR